MRTKILMEVSNNYRTQKMGLVRRLTVGRWGRDRYFYPLNIVRGFHRLGWSTNFKNVPFSLGFNFYFNQPKHFFLVWYPKIKLFCFSFFRLLFVFYRNI